MLLLIGLFGHIPAPLCSGNGQVAHREHSFDRNQPGVLPQTVTTVWRTELGTTLLIGFNSTTVLSAYFRHLGIPSLPRNTAPSSSPVWPRHVGTLLLRSTEHEHHSRKALHQS